jgi:hypothetical protein
MLVPFPMPFAPPASGVAPPTHGLSLDRAFFSLDAQAGRPVVLALVGRASLGAARPALELLQARSAVFAALGVDLAALVDIESPQAPDFAGAGGRSLRIVYSRGEVFRDWGFSQPRPVFIGLDRAARILPAPSDPSEATVTALLAAYAARPHEGRQDDLAPAPLLAIPNLLPRELCGGLIAHFERSAPGLCALASVRGETIDAARKPSRDFALEAGDPFLAPVIASLAARAAPEIRRAFQVEVAHADRVLIARCDDEAGGVPRQRGNAAPAGFRQFALSINLNDDFEGGHTLFPEFNDRRYRLAAGAGLVFSAALLHEAAPVERGRRYVALTFLHDAAAQTRRLEAERAAS